MKNSLAFISAGVFEEIAFSSVTWDDDMKRPSYRGFISGTTTQVLLPQYNFVHLVPIEAQASAAKCGSSSYITWVLYYSTLGKAVIFSLFELNFYSKFDYTHDNWLAFNNFFYYFFSSHFHWVGFV